MINQVVVDRINQQIQHELSNAYIYQGVSLYFSGINLNGFAAWFSKQASEERIHASKLIEHLINRGAVPELGALGAVKTTYDSPHTVTQLVVKLEEGTTALIYKLFEFAKEEKDYPLEVLLQWFVTEQVEEEKYWGRRAAED